MITFGKISNIVVVTAAALGCAACNNDIVFSDSKPLDPRGWMQNAPAIFELDPAAFCPEPSNRFAILTARATGDTISRLRGEFMATLSLRYTGDCNAWELKVVAERSALDRPIRTDTLFFRLFDSSGAPCGKGNLGIYEVSATLPYIFSVTEGTTLSILPDNYKTPPRGICDATLLLFRLHK